jgi:hypothetical protein
VIDDDAIRHAACLLGVARLDPEQLELVLRSPDLRALLLHMAKQATAGCCGGAPTDGEEPRQ